MRKFAFPALFCALAATAAEPPAVFWASSPTRPGEHVLLGGGGWSEGEDLAVEIGGRRVKPDMVSRTGLVFGWPADLAQSVAEARVVGASGTSKPVVLNAPEVWWMQGDDHDASTPGGWLRVFGRALDFGGRAKVRLAGNGGTRELALTHRGTWDLAAEVPADLACGEYEVTVDSGLGAGAAVPAGRWKVAAAKPFWKETVFDIEDFGATPNDETDDGWAIAAALEAAKANGGGVVRIPRGSYCCGRTLELPPHTLLKGEGRDRSEIAWRDDPNPPTALILGSHSFGVEDLRLSAVSWCNGIMASHVDPNVGGLICDWGIRTHDVSVRRVRLHFVSDYYRCNYNAADMWNRFKSNYGAALRLRAVSRCVIEDTEIYADKRARYYDVDGEYIRFVRSSVSGTGSTWCVLGGDRVIFEGNTGFNVTYSVNNCSRRVFWGRNRTRDVYTNDREGITTDGRITAFASRRLKKGETYPPGATSALSNGLLNATADGTRMKLEWDPRYFTPGGGKQASSDWVGYTVLIASGRGTGQSRTITAFPDWHTLETDRPWDIAPDATSGVCINAERRHLLFVENEMEDVGPLMIFGGCNDVVIAGNRFRNATGATAFGLKYAGGMVPCWNVQFIGNVIEGCPSGRSRIGNLRDPIFEELTLNHVMRDNVVRSGGYVAASSMNGVTEGNVIAQADTGIGVFVRSPRTQFIGRNELDGVLCPLMGNARLALLSDAARKGLEDAKARLVSDLAKAGRTEMSCVKACRLLGFTVSGFPARGRARGSAVEVRVATNSTVTPRLTGARVTLKGVDGWLKGGASAELKPNDRGELAAVLPLSFVTNRPGLATYPAALELRGEGWTLATECELGAGARRTAGDWQVAYLPTNEFPQAAVRTVPFSKKDAWRIRLDELPPVPEGAAAVMLRTSFTLGRELDMGFNRMDDYTDVYLDGKPLIPRMRRDWFWRNSDLTLRLDAGRHELTLIRLLKPEKAPRANEDDLRLQWWVPVALRPGDISFEVGCNPQKTKTFSAAVKN